MLVDVGGPCSYQYGAGIVLIFSEAAEEQLVTWPKASDSQDLKPGVPACPVPHSPRRKGGAGRSWVREQVIRWDP